MKEKVYTGFRPTGDLHLGHFFSLILPLSKLYRNQDLYILVADIHSFTEFRKSGTVDLIDFSNNIDSNILEALRIMSHFIPLENHIVFRQSRLKEYHYDLTFKLMMLAKFSSAFGNPIFQHTMRTEIDNIIDEQKFDPISKIIIRTEILKDDAVYYGGIEEHKINKIQRALRANEIEISYDVLLKFITKLNTRTGIIGFASYPMLMATDIILYSPEYVLVGADQEPHLQITNEMIRILNNKFNLSIPIIKPMIITDVTFKGADGNKMSKTLQNYVSIHDLIHQTDIAKNWFMGMKTFPRLRKDPGIPSQCVVGEYYNNLNIETNNLIDCGNAEIGCVQCKEDLYNYVINLVSNSIYRETPLSYEEIGSMLINGECAALNRIRSSNHLGQLI